MIETVRIGGRSYELPQGVRFTVGDREYLIVGSRATGRGYYNTIDTVKNDKGEYRDFTRSELIKFMKG